jgi:hypothetical protein
MSGLGYVSEANVINIRLHSKIRRGTSRLIYIVALYFYLLILGGDLFLLALFLLALLVGRLVMLRFICKILMT